MCCRRRSVLKLILGSIAVSSDGDYLFVTNPDANTVSVVDIGNGPPFKVLSPAIRVGGCPMGIAVSPKGDYVFVCTPNDSTVSVIDVKRAAFCRPVAGDPCWIWIHKNCDVAER